MKSASMGKVRILIVDEDRSTLTVISGILKKHGYDVFTALDGRDGLRKAYKEKPHLIILDITIPGMDGYQLARRLKRDPETADIAVLILSAKGNTDENVKEPREFSTRVRDQLRGFDSGAMDFLAKPVKAKDVVKRVKALLWASGLD